MAQLALALGVEPSFFLAGPNDDLEVQPAHFRSLRSTTQVVRDQANAYGLLVVDIAASLERHVELPQRNLPEFPVPPDQKSYGLPEEAARNLRRDWRLPQGPVGHTIRLAEHHGILVAFSVPQVVAVDAFSLDTGFRPLILLNPVRDDYYRQRFDVAHEIGHLVMHQEAEPGGRIVEDQAHRFASEFLMPEEEIAGSLPIKANWPKLHALKEKWGVSIQALLMRARQLSIMSESSYTNAMTTLSARGWRRREPGAMPVVEQPSLLPRSLELLAEAGYDEDVLMNACRVPAEIFRLATARQPQRTPLSYLEDIPGTNSGSDEANDGVLLQLSDFKR